MKIGQIISTANERTTNEKRPYAEVRAAVLQAESDGLDSVWLADHLFYERPGLPVRGMWECWTILAALAEATERIELGTLTLCNSLRNPAVLAKMATALDEVSGGRLTVGIGAGWNEPEYKAFGLPFDHRVDRFEEALQILAPLLHDGKADFDGRYYTARDCQDAPRGPRAAGPPLLVGAEGPRMMRLTARYADLWNIGYLGEPETLAEPLAKIGAACREVGRDPATLGITVLVGVWFPELGAEKPAFFPTPLTGPPQEIAEALHGYRELGVVHVVFQTEPYTADARRLVAEAVRLYHRAE